MGIKGIEQIMPKVDHMGRLQRAADEGAAAERFVLQLNQQLQAKRQSVNEAKPGEQQQIDDKSQHERKGRRQLKPQKKGALTRKTVMTDIIIPGRGNKLDVRT
jgi:hypothetical protein